MYMYPYHWGLTHEPLNARLMSVIIALLEGDEGIFAIGSELKRLNACLDHSLFTGVT